MQKASQSAKCFPDHQSSNLFLLADSIFNQWMKSEPFYDHFTAARYIKSHFFGTTPIAYMPLDKLRIERATIDLISRN